MEVRGDRNMTENIPISEKFTLTIAEANVYFNIGRDKLYELAKEEGNNYVLHNGKTILFKRKQLEKFLENKMYI